MNHEEYMAKYMELQKLSKTELIRMLRDGGLIWSMNPLEKQTREELISSVLDQERSRES